MAVDGILDGIMVPLIRQRRRTDCGVACLLMVLNFYHCITSYESLCHMAGVDEEKGTSLAKMVETIERFGFVAKAVRGGREAFFENYVLPCIALVQLQTGAMHYVVVYERSRERVIIADPAVGIIKLRPEEFLDGKKRRWFAARYHWTGILIFMKKKVSGEQFNIEERYGETSI